VFIRCFGVKSGFNENLLPVTVRFDQSRYLFNTVAFSENVQRLLSGPFSNPDNNVACVRVKGCLHSKVIMVGGPIGNSASWISIPLYGVIKKYRKRRELKIVAERYKAYLNNLQSIGEKVKRISCHAWTAQVHPYIYVEEYNPLSPVGLEQAKVTKISGSVPESRTPRFYRGSNGEYGIVPDGTKVSDLICEFEESSAVAVLRKRDSFYDLVGRALIIEDIGRPASNDRVFKAGFGTNRVVCPPVRSSSDTSTLKKYADIVMDLETLQLLTF